MGNTHPYSIRLDGKRVFVTDGLWRKTVAAVRGLGRMGVRVTVGESTYLAPAFFSRYCHSRIRVPSPVLHPSAYVDFIENYLASNPHDVVLPMEETTLLLLARNRARLDGRTRLPVAAVESLLFARDKLKVIKRAQRIGIPVPGTFEVKSLADGEAISAELPYPVVIKPRIGAGSSGIHYVNERASLMSALRQSFESGSRPIIQEQLPRSGPGIGVSLLLDENGLVRASFVHRRLREYPVEGGPSTLRESYLCDEAKDHAVRLLQDLGLTGVAMVEFKMDARDGRPKLLEVNPRFWGSLALAIDSGVNFPYLITLMALGYDFEPVTDYRVGHRCRWLLPGDILHFWDNPRRFHMEPSFFQFRGPNLTYDIIDLEDPGPILGTALAILPFFGRKEFKHVRLRRAPDGTAGWQSNCEDRRHDGR